MGLEALFYIVILIACIVFITMVSLGARRRQMPTFKKPLGVTGKMKDTEEEQAFHEKQPIRAATFTMKERPPRGEGEEESDDSIGKSEKTDAEEKEAEHEEAEEDEKEEAEEEESEEKEEGETEEKEESEESEKSEEDGEGEESEESEESEKEEAEEKEEPEESEGSEKEEHEKEEDEDEDEEDEEESEEGESEHETHEHHHEHEAHEAHEHIHAHEHEHEHAHEEHAEHHAHEAHEHTHEHIHEEHEEHEKHAEYELAFAEFSKPVWLYKSPTEKFSQAQVQQWLSTRPEVIKVVAEEGKVYAYLKDDRCLIVHAHGIEANEDTPELHELSNKLKDYLEPPTPENNESDEPTLREED